MFVLVILGGINLVQALATVENLEEKIKMIDAEIEYNMKTHNIPGMAFSLIDGEGVLYSKGYGTLDVRDATLEVNENTNFHLGSVSKVFVSVAIMKLQEEGSIDIEKPVKDYLPWFSTKDVQLSKDIKIKHLLNHSSGLPGRLNVHDISNSERQEIVEEIKRKLNEVTLVGKPGNVFEYTNMNTDLLQLIIEEITGVRFTQYMEQNIYKPLNMNRTGYFIFDNSQLTNTAMGHQYHWEKIKPYKEELVFATSASAGLSSNVNDLSIFVRLLLNNGKGSNGTLISSSGLNLLFQPNEYGVGYNWYVYPHNIFMDGGLPGFTSTIVLSSDKTFGLVLLSNSKQDITYHSGFNLYRIVDGGLPTQLLAEDFPKVGYDAKLVLLIILIICVLIAGLVGYNFFQLVKGKKEMGLIKPSYKKVGLIGFLLILYLVVMYCMHVILPFYIGVPTLKDFKKEPDFVTGMYILTIVFSILVILLFGKILCIQTLKRSNQ